jgi:hypothetical protein
MLFFTDLSFKKILADDFTSIFCKFNSFFSFIYPDDVVDDQFRCWSYLLYKTLPRLSHGRFAPPEKEKGEFFEIPRRMRPLAELLPLLPTLPATLPPLPPYGLPRLY